MLETPHVALGAAIATKVPNPLLAVPLCLVSHFVLDRVPHWNPHTYTETQKHGYPTKKTFAITIADVGVALILGLYVASQAVDISQAALVVGCSFVSVLPDVSKYPYFLFKKARRGLMRKWVEYERKFQVDAGFVPGMLTQIVTIVASLWWLYN